MQSSPVIYSIITTCKGRLHNLLKSLPTFLLQEDCEVIVVDYDCPDGTADYLTKNHPEARPVKVIGQAKFNSSHARNLGAASAMGDFLIFLDADVVIHENFVKTIRPMMTPEAFAVFGPPAKNSLRGCCIVPREKFVKVDGYDELIGGYEGEDLDLYARLRLICSAQISLKPDIVLEIIEQSMEERIRFRAPDLKAQFLRGQLYSMAKEMVMTEMQSPLLDLTARKQMLQEIDRNLMGLYAGTQDFVLEINLPDKYRRVYLNEWEFSRSIAVKAKRKTKL